MSEQHDSAAVRIVLGLFNRLFALLPRNFIDRHRGDSDALMTQLVRDGYRAHGAAGAATAGVRAAADLIVNLPGEYLRFSALGGDVWFALRSMRRNAVSTSAAVVTLAAGIGLNAAVFTVVDWVLFRPLPYPAPQQLVRIMSAGTAPITPPGDVSYSEAARFGGARSLRAAAAYSSTMRVIAADGVEPFHGVVARIRGDWFGTFGVRPQIGRAIEAREADAGAAVAVVSYSAWRQRFFGDPSIVGRAIRVERDAVTIVGVMPPGLGYPAAAEFWRPVTAAEREDDDRENTMIARLADGVSAESASLELTTIADAASEGKRRAWADDLQSTQVRGVRPALVVLWASAGLVLLMACANVAALISARGADRARELAVRAAVGASRARLVQQLVTESVLLTAFGGTAGLLLGHWALAAMVSLAPQGLPRAAEIALDARVLGVGIVATLAIGVLVGAATAVRSSRLDFGAAFAAASPAVSRRRGGRQMLVGAQTAVAVVLTVLAVLFGRMLYRRVAVDHGLAVDRLITVELNLRNAPAGNERQTFDVLIDASTSVSGVRAAAVGLRPPHLPGPRIGVRAEGGPAGARKLATLRPVSSRYFETAGLRRTGGRLFERSDRRGAPRVAIVNDSFARDVLVTHDAVGARLKTDLFDDPVTIVGTISDVTLFGQREDPAIYFSIEQVPIGGAALIVRTDGDPRAVVGALRARLRAAAPALALDRLSRMSESLAARRSDLRFNAELSSAFAVLALMLACVSVYGLTAGEVIAREREISIRVALGAPWREAWWTVVRSAAIASAAGATAGGLLAARTMRWIRSWLAPLTAGTPADADLPTLLMVVCALALVAAAAASSASVRALHADPAATLRGD